MIRALIIDDIKDARDNIRLDIKTYCSDVEIVGEAEGVVSGAKAIRELNPEVVFLDIQMQDGTGFDLLDIIGDINFNSKTIVSPGITFCLNRTLSIFIK